MKILKLVWVVVLILTFSSFLLNLRAKEKIDFDKKSVPELIELLKHEELGIRGGAAVRLGEIGDKTAVPALMGALNDPHWGIRWRAAEALGKIKDVAALDALLVRLKYECETEWTDLLPSHWGSATTDEFLETEITLAILQIAEAAKETVVPKLMTEVNDRNLKYKHRIAIVLGQLGEKRIVPILIEGSKLEDRGLQRAWIVRTLGNLGDESAIPALKEALNDPYQTPQKGIYAVRQAAALALQKLGVKVEKKGPGEYMAVPISLKNGTVFVSLRLIASNFGSDVLWNHKSKQAIVVVNTKRIKLRLGSIYASVNGQSVRSESAPILREGSLLIPLKFLAKALGLRFAVNHEYKVVYIWAPNIPMKGLVTK